MKLSPSTFDLEPAPRRKSCNIAAIDFGTTNCSVAYTTVGSRSEKPQILPLNNTYYRVPVAILFKTDGTIDSFGYDARKEYFNLDDKDRLEYAYFEQIKMSLQHDEVFVTEGYLCSIYIRKYTRPSSLYEGLVLRLNHSLSTRPSPREEGETS